MSICRRCYWEEKGYLSGQGFTDFTCELCGKQDTWANTNTPRFCHECSKSLDMCQRCGNTLKDDGCEKEF